MGGLGLYVYLEGTPQQSEKFQKTKTGKMEKRKHVKQKFGKIGKREF